MIRGLRAPDPAHVCVSLGGVIGEGFPEEVTLELDPKGEGGEEHSRQREKARHGCRVGSRSNLEGFSSLWGASRVRAGPERPGPLAGARCRVGVGGGCPAGSRRCRQQFRASRPSAPSCFRASTSFLCTDHRGVSEETATYFSSDPWTPPPTAAPEPRPLKRHQVILRATA